MKEIHKHAVVGYINHRLASFSHRKAKLKQVPIPEDWDLQENVQKILYQIGEAESIINYTMKRSKDLLQEILTTNERLAECNTLYNRYQALKSQYAADIKRLAFIVEGELHRYDVPVKTKCPFCDSHVLLQKKETNAEAYHAACHRIQLQLKDLAEAEKYLVAERTALEERLLPLDEEKSAIEAFLNHELKPKVTGLKHRLAEYRRAIEIQYESKVIEKFGTRMTFE